VQCVVLCSAAKEEEEDCVEVVCVFGKLKPRHLALQNIGNLAPIAKVPGT
jgi:hypothetical protein